MNTVDETVKCLPDGHLNGHVAAHAEEKRGIVIPASNPGSTAAQRPSSEQIKKTIDELARLSPLEFAVVKKERAAELELTLLDLTRAVNERRKALKAKAAIEDDDDTRESQADTLVRYACDASQFYSNPNNEDETYALVKTNGHRECWTAQKHRVQSVAALPVLQPHRPRPKVRRLQPSARYARCESALRGRIGADIPAPCRT